MSLSPPRRKVSREGLVLIKSLEGFTPRAVERQGGWVIGYGHTRSAREGLSVSEADAELLLQYDLLPVVAALNDTVRVDLNQHQFDALASFALSVGVEPFVASDVLSTLNREGPEAAARRLGERPDVDPALARPGRRRAVERAMFEADPAQPVAIGQLLAAPAPELNVTAPATADDAQPATPAAPGMSGTHAAISHLLGEPVEAASKSAEPTPDAPPAEEAMPGEQAVDDRAVDVPTSDGAEPAVSLETERDVATEAEPADLAEAAPPPTQEVVQEPASTEDVETTVEADAPAPAPVDPAVRAAAMAQMTWRQFAPFSAPMTGALPTPPRPEARAPEPPVASAPSPAEPAPPPPIAATAPAPEPLILTPPELEPAAARAAWSPEERALVLPRPEAGIDLFSEEELAAETSLGPVLRHEDLEEPRRGVEFGEIGAYAGMAAVGLVSLGAAAPAFQALMDQGAGGGAETLLIFAALILIGGGCSGIAGYNLYKLWRRAQGRDA